MTCTYGPLAFIQLDFESTDIDVVHAEIWEVAVIATDMNYNEITRFRSLVRPSERGRERFFDRQVVVDMHTKSGLLSELMTANIQDLPALADVEDRILALIAEHGSPEQFVALGGGGVAHFDRPLIAVQMPRLAEKLTYWSDDVSAARRLYERTVGHDIIGTDKAAKTHRAMDDIVEDLSATKAFRDLYLDSVKPRCSKDHPFDRVLSGLALVDAFNDSAVFADGDEVAYSVDTASTITTLLATTAPQDIIFGLMDVASSLLSRVAAAEGLTERVVVDEYRNTILNALASAPAPETDTSFQDRA